MFALISWDKCCPELYNSFSELAVWSDVVKREGLGKSSGIHSIGSKRGNALLLGAALWISLAGPELTPCSLFLQLSWLVTLQNMNPLSSAEVKRNLCGNRIRKRIPTGWLSGKIYSTFILSWLFPKQWSDWFIGCLQLKVGTWGTWVCACPSASSQSAAFYFSEGKNISPRDWMEFAWLWELRQVVITLRALFFQGKFMPPFEAVQTPVTLLESCEWMVLWMATHL